MTSARASFFRASCVQTWHLFLEFLDDADALSLPLIHQALRASSDLAGLLVGRRGFHLALVAESLRTQDLVLHAIRAGAGGVEDARRLWRSVPPKLKTQQLTERRAAAVRSYLTENWNIEGGRMTAVGYGFNRPKGPNDPDTGNRENERIDVFIRR